MKFNLSKSLWMRFLRGAVAGAVSSGALIIFAGDYTFQNLKNFLITVLIAVVIGAVNGSLLAIDKYIRSK